MTERDTMSKRESARLAEIADRRFLPWNFRQKTNEKLLARGFIWKRPGLLFPEACITNAGREALEGR